MAKNIVFCADGTWNGPSTAADDPPSNVFKLFAALAGGDRRLELADEQERRLGSAAEPRQIAKYLHGVGDSANPLVQAIGGALGAGVITRIVRGYTFVSRHYRAGDRIFLVGFSRGAYTVRALAGLIAARGLLDPVCLPPDDPLVAYRQGLAVWADYRCHAVADDRGLLGKLQDVIRNLPAALVLDPPQTMVTGVAIEAVAVWDTVGALGIPNYDARRERLECLRFCDTRLSACVRRGFHAVAVDEQRADFTPTLWDADPRVEQALFPGAHADVGGGYPAAESGLADGALRWLGNRLKSLGVVFADPLPGGDPRAPAHAPWRHLPFSRLKRAVRRLPPGLAVHGSLLERLGSGPLVPDPGRPPEPYRPENLTAYVDYHPLALLPGIRVV